MIGHAFLEGQGPKQLLGGEKAGDWMGKRHRTERNPAVGPRFEILVDPCWSSDDQTDGRGTILQIPSQLMSQPRRIDDRSQSIKKPHRTRIATRFLKAAALVRHAPRSIARSGTNPFDGNRKKAPDSLDVVVDRRTQNGIPGPADPDEQNLWRPGCSFHSIPYLRRLSRRVFRLIPRSSAARLRLPRVMRRTSRI